MLADVWSLGLIVVDMYFGIGWFKNINLPLGLGLVTDTIRQEKVIKLLESCTDDNVKQLIENTLAPETNRWSIIEVIKFIRLQQAVPLEKFYVSLRSIHGFYLSVKLNGNILANSKEATTWETLLIRKYGNNISLKSYHNKYLSAELSGKVIANKDEARENEIFTIEVTDDIWYLKSNQNKYLCVDQNGEVVATVEKAKNARFTLFKH